MSKKFITFILFLIIINFSFGQSGWFWQNPLPQGNELKGVQFINDNTGYSCGYYGTIMKTTNAGVNWTVFNIPEVGLRDFSRIFFINDLTGWAAGGQTVFIVQTTNGGNSWTINNLAYNGVPSSLLFLNEATGFIGVSNQLYKTTNNGTSWSPVLSIGVNCSMSFVNSQTGWIVYNNSPYCDTCTYPIFKTTNCGDIWFNEFSSLTGPLSSVDFTDVNTGYICGRNGVMKSTNSGVNWFTINNTPYLINLKFLNQFIGFVNFSLTGGGNFIYTSDGGNNWFSAIAPSAITDFSLTELNSIYTVGNDSRIRKSSNYGSTWQNLSSGYYLDLYDIYFLNQSTGFAVGGKLNSSENQILKTTNGGVTWNSSFSTLSGFAKTVFFINDSVGWVGGNYNGAYNTVIYKTTDCGSNWFPQNTTLNNGVNSIFFIDQNYGWVASGYSSMSLYTTNGGNNWIRYNGPYQVFNDIYFIDHLTGFEVGGDGVYKSVNGGLNWTKIYSSDNPKSISVVDANNMYICGFSYVKKTTNGGTNWSVFDFNLLFPVCIKFVNLSTGFLIANNVYGTQGRIYKSTDAGSSWPLLNIGKSKDLNSIYFLNEITGWVVGNSGTILKTTDGGGQFIGIKGISNVKPAEYLLSQNYPNPFNPQTKIKFDIPKQSFTKLIIYDLLGREVATLVNEELKPGTYEASWDGSNYASGVYFYKLIAGDFSQTKKMILMK